jgi:hypothetical protein
MLDGGCCQCWRCRCWSFVALCLEDRHLLQGRAVLVVECHLPLSQTQYRSPQIRCRHYQEFDPSWKLLFRLLEDSSSPSPYTVAVSSGLFFSPSTSLTFFSTICHFSPSLPANMDHISLRTAAYSLPKLSSCSGDQSSALRFSISRSWRLRQALGVLVGKCRSWMGAQLRP